MPETEVTAVVVVEEQVLRKWTVPIGGLFSIRTPANTGIKIFVDGQLLIDASGDRVQEVGEVITALVTLEPGDHAVKVTGMTEENLSIAAISINAAGENPIPFLALTTPIDAVEANTIVAERSVLNPRAGGANKAGSFIAATGRAPFAIGGGSSHSAAAARNAPAAIATQMAAATPVMMGSGAQMPAAPAPTRTSGGTTSLGSVSGSSGSGNSGDGGSSGGSTGGTGGGGQDGNGGSTPPTATPTPTPTPAPTPPAAPVEGRTEVPPLTPPTAPVLTQAIQLTSAGTAEGELPNTGATLFGAAMDNTLFNVVDVSIAPTNRTTRVSIGSETGQFAVRLFEEDFAQGPEVTVTLTGALEGNDEVQSTPISYALRGTAPNNGLTQALSRLTFGPTPELYARVRAIGFEAFVEEQLNPTAINDSAFLNTRPQDLLNTTTRNSGLLFNSLTAHSIAYAAYTERQLNEVMGNFWANHFHAVTKGTPIHQQNVADRAFFRENALGNFEDLLLYSARSPLMSQFLDNDENRAGRINENYGREVLELSTVGVDAGYGPDDVIAVSRIFTGWAYEQTNPNADAEEVAREYAFRFFPDRHDIEDKAIPFLGILIPGRAGEEGVQEGDELIAILAQHASTRSHVCGKLVQLLVSDQPPQALVNACAAAWETSGGEVVAMLRAILLDPSFIANVDYQRAKAKTPLEYSVSAIRAFGATPQADRVDAFYNRFRGITENAGYNMMRFGAPTGLPEVGAAWTNSATMVSLYDGMSTVAEFRQDYGIDLLSEVTDAGLETAEEVASYILTVSTADRFTLNEFDEVVATLKGSDGIFEPLTEGVDETRALERAMGLTFITPSFLLQ